MLGFYHQPRFGRPAPALDLLLDLAFPFPLSLRVGNGTEREERMRHTYVVSYDVADAKRLRQVQRTMLGYGDWLQLSVFRCDVSARELVELRAALGTIIHQKEDHVLFVLVGPTEGRGGTAFSTLGKSYEAPSLSAVVV